MDNTFYTISLRQILITQKGIKPVLLKNTFFEGAIPYLDINALETNQFREYSYPELGNLVNEGDLLIVWDGSRSGLVLKGKYGITGSTLMKVTPIEFDQDYLFYFIKSNYAFINRNTVGGGIPHVNPEIFYNLHIPYLPLDKQKEVIRELTFKLEKNASILKQQENDIQNSLFDEGITKNSHQKSTLEIIQNFRNSIFEKAISGDLTIDWRFKRNIVFPKDEVLLDSVIIQIKSGKSFRCLERTPVENEIGVAKISAVSNFGFLENESKTCLDKTKINSDLYIKKHDFLITRANTKELVGSCSIVEKINKKIMLSDKIWRVTFDNTRVLDRFVLLLLQSTLGREQIENFASGSQESMKNITQSDLRSIIFKIPSIAEQEEIIKQSNLLVSIADNLLEKYKNSLDTFSKLEQSILQQLFKEEHLVKYQTETDFKSVIEKIKLQKTILENKLQKGSKDRSKARSIMKKAVTEISTLDVEDVLKQNKVPMLAKEVWKASKYSNDIDAFYEAVKHKVPSTLKWEIIKEDEEVPESVISLNTK